MGKGQEKRLRQIEVFEKLAADTAIPEQSRSLFKAVAWLSRRAEDFEDRIDALEDAMEEK